jgi:alpha-mannosidase
MDKQWINAMSHSALALIYEKENDEESKAVHVIELKKIGGWEAVDKSWIETIKKHLDLN